ncbi:2Fe-2S iron-sulfur cluster-binding protein [Synechococcus elongatus]|uniref:2Fe-2S iron-sulfur cluster-binding protein n=1 Tax=Synechococcus elongatus PCC 11802 TaxID=2283154 RepID=A0AAT9JWH1_SYNEL|nr:2Fe-2S iron-sulfur cluster-binding protein [Synechococcus elongatus]QFZ91977.1 (2Fe-2S)-binding protein [Synechococcus elongatus PCC 11802]
MTITVHFLPDDVRVTAEAGEPLLTVAERAGLRIPTGCLMGSCHACEVDLDGEPVCGCITAIPDSATGKVIVDCASDPGW